MPIKRFAHSLARDGHAEAYRELLLASFNPGTLPGLMCRAGYKSILVSSDGRLNVCQRFVGKDTRATRFCSDFTSLLSLPRSFTRHNCYTRDVIGLADRLLQLYTRHYPQYLSVDRLDRILFGTI